MRRSPCTTCSRGSRRATGGRGGAVAESGVRLAAAALASGCMRILVGAARRGLAAARSESSRRYTSRSCVRRKGKRGIWMAQETEIKLKINSAADLRRRLKRLCAKIIVPRTLEVNVLFDTAESDLKTREELLRIRTETLTGAPNRGKARSGR